MNTLTYSFEHGDYNYKSAVNYDGRNYYNPPMTITVNGTLFILPFGTSDRKHTKEDGNMLTIVAENKPLNYISMCVIDITDNSIVDCYLSDNDIDCKDSPAHGIFDLELDDQIRVLENYLPY